MLLFVDKDSSQNYEMRLESQNETLEESLEIDESFVIKFVGKTNN